ncbi:MAG: Rpn family recombination-promoting nuclease/putative transposase, partial [Planctomycetes bacterium]|nr:Rpn family recombination-promoting nuclease/putative transposase [Planctomycetota bacterium]
MARSTRTGGRSRSVAATPLAEEMESRPGLVGAVDAAAERPGRGICQCGAPARRRHGGCVGCGWMGRTMSRAALHRGMSWLAWRGRRTGALACLRTASRLGDIARRTVQSLAPVRNHRAVRGPYAGMAPPRTHDGLFRFVFGEPEQMAELLQSQLPPALTAAIDWPTLRRIDGSFVDAALQDRLTDLLFEVEVHGAPLLLHVVVDHKSRADWATALQLARYTLRI